ncbi:MAG: DNA polymerase I [Lachnospiraceae bacterium]|nr:DNA polymerase I [Lachnospiraceae bacterium]
MKLLLIDGHSILNRAYYGVPDFTNSEGIHTGAIYGFLNMMFSFLDSEKPDYLAVAFDCSAPTFRHEKYADYKGNRKGMDPELRQQVPMIQEMLSSMDIPVIKQEGIEGDDILGTLSRVGERSDLDVTIVSGDRDTLQLATDRVKISIPRTKKTGTIIENYYAKDVLETLKVTPVEFIDVKALMGDSSDNIPGVPGIGEKTATALIEKYHSIEAAYEDWENVKPPRASKNLHEFYDQAVMSKDLATIKLDCEIDFKIEDAKLENIFTEEAYELCKKWELRKILSHFEAPKNLEQTENPKENYVRVEEGMENEIIEKLSLKKELGFYLLTSGQKDDDRNFGLFIADSDKTYYLNEIENPEEVALKFLEKGIMLCFPDIKEALHLMPGVNDFRNSHMDSEVFFDAQVAAYILDPLPSEYPMDSILKKECNILVPSLQELLKKKSIEKAFAAFYEDEEVREALIEYGFINAYSALKVKDSEISKLKELDMYNLYRDIELPLIFTLFDMEKYGMKMDREALLKYGEELKVTRDELERRIYEMAGEEFNINSPKQLSHILFEKLEIPGGKKTKTGYSTAADVLEKLKNDNPIIDDILTYRKYQKIMSTYVEGLAQAVSKDGRVHSLFQQKVTATGRISSTEPNLQNIPIRLELGKKIRKVFYPADGYTFVDADYSQIELRVLASMSGDENLQKAYNEGKDIHRATAARVFHKDFDEVTDNERRNAKAVNFGIVYGISAFGLAEDLHISRTEAKDYIDEYYSAYPKLKSYLDGLVSEAKDKGYAETYFKRRRPTPELTSSNFMKRGFGERIAKNSPIQGTAADIIKIAMVKVHDRLVRDGYKSRLVLQVHDELLIETENSELEDIKKLLVEEMQNAAKLNVPLIADLETGDNWYETH